MVRLDLALHLEVRENEYFSSLILMEHCKGSERSASRVTSKDRVER
jgi:hypothetical protein